METQRKKTKVLMFTSQLAVGGVEIVAARLQKYMDSNLFECIICADDGEHKELEEQMKEYGAKIIHKPIATNNLIKEYKNIKKVLTADKYDVVHSHMTFYSGLIMLVAKKVGIKKRVSHAHATQPIDRGFLRNTYTKAYRVLMRFLMKKYGTDFLACSEVAGVFVYGEKFFKEQGVVLNNGIDLENYKLDDKTRDEIREEIGADKDTIVVGHIGSFNYIKNQVFLAEIFEKFQKKHPNSLFVMAGAGEPSYRKKVEDKIKELKIEEKVRILGCRQDVNRVLMSYDIMVFPSLHEGLPLAMVEAQGTSLPCLVSSGVTKDVKLNDNVDFASLKEPISVWNEKMEKLLEGDRKSVDLTKLYEQYSIYSVENKLSDIYLEKKKIEIPKKLHYCWFGGKEKPLLVKKCIESWEKYCPDYEIVEWNEKNFDINSVRFVKEAYEAKKWAFVADYARLYALYTEGGIYLDTDVELFKPLDYFLKYESFSGFESKDSPAVCLTGANKGNKIIKEFMQYYESRSFKKKDGYDMTPNPRIFTDIMVKHGLKLNGSYQVVDGMAFFPEVVFSPNNFRRIFGFYSKKSYSVHHIAGSWGDGASFTQVRPFHKRVLMYLVRVARDIVGTKRVAKIIEKVKG